MDRIRQAWIWLRRAGHSRGFGIQSPTDYRFERCVINERWPYYAYDTMGMADGWKRRKLGRLYFRIANFMQPSVVIDLVGAEEYVRMACPGARGLSHDTQSGDAGAGPVPARLPGGAYPGAGAGSVDMAVVPINTEYQQLFRLCHDKSVVVIEDIHKQPPLWHCIEYSPMTSVTFDLYHCGIVFFDKSRSKHNYTVNF